MTTPFGFKPLPAKFYLTEDTDFSQTIRTFDGADWPVGTVIKLNLTKDGVTTSWTATITGPDATLAADKAVVNALTPGSKITGTVTETVGTADLTWYIGNVVWTLVP